MTFTTPSVALHTPMRLRRRVDTHPIYIWNVNRRMKFVSRLTLLTRHWRFRWSCLRLLLGVLVKTLKACRVFSLLEFWLECEKNGFCYISRFTAWVLVRKLQKCSCLSTFYYWSLCIRPGVVLACVVDETIKYCDSAFHVFVLGILVRS